MSMLKICGQELELDLFDADVMDRFENALEDVQKKAEEYKKKEHPEFENDVTVETISHIKNVYQQCWKEHSFL